MKRCAKACVFELYSASWIIIKIYFVPLRIHKCHSFVLASSWVTVIVLVLNYYHVRLKCCYSKHMFCIVLWIWNVSLPFLLSTLFFTLRIFNHEFVYLQLYIKVWINKILSIYIYHFHKNHRKRNLLQIVNLKSSFSLETVYHNNKSHTHAHAHTHAQQRE